MKPLHKHAFLFLLLILWGTQPLFSVIGGYDYAEKLYQDGYFDLAVEEYKTFINENPQDRRVESAYQRLIASYHQLGKTNMVLTEGNRFIQRYPKSPHMGDILFFIASALRKSGMNVQALDAVEQIRRFYRDASFYTESLFLAADLYIEADKGEKYLQAMKEIINLNPRGSNLKKAYHSLLKYHFERNEMEKAKGYWEKLSEQDMEPGLWSWYKGEIAFGLRDYSTALKEYQSLMNKYPQSPYYEKALYGRGLVFMRRGAYAEAVTAFSTLLEKNPNSSAADDALQGKAEALFQLKRINEAAKEIDYFLKTYPESPLYPEVIRLALSMEKKEEGGWDTDKIRSLYGDLVGYYESRGRDADVKRVFLEQAESFERGTFYAYAVHALLDYVSTYPGDPEVPWLVYRVGHLYAYEMKDYERAIAAYERNSFNAEGYGDKSLYEMGYCYEKLKRYDRAVYTYQTIQERFPFSSLSDRAAKRIRYLEHYIMTDTEKGLAALDALLEQQMASPLPEKELLKKRGDIFYEMKQFEQAYDYYTKAGVRDEKTLRAGAYALMTGNATKKEAADFFNRHKDHPSAPEIYADVLVYYDMENQLEEEDFLLAFSLFPASTDEATARAYIDFLIREDKTAVLKDPALPESISGTSTADYALALKAYYRSDFGEAESLFKRLPSEKPEDKANISFYLADIYYKTGRPAEAENLLLNITRPFEMKVKASLLLAEMSFKQARYEDTIFNIYNVLNRMPGYYNDPRVMRLYLDALILAGRKETAGDVCAQITAQKGELAAVKGLACLRLGLDGSAMTLLRQARDKEIQRRIFQVLAEQERWRDILELFPESDAYAVSRRIIAMTRLNRIEEALSLKKTNSRLIKDYNEELALALGEYYYLQKKDINAAEKYFKEAGGSKTPLETQWNLEAAFMLGNIHLSRGEGAQAEEIYGLLEANPAFGPKEKLYLSMGQLSYSKGNTEKAREYFSRSYHFKPNPEALYNLGLLHKGAREQEEARMAFQQVIDRFPHHPFYNNARINIVIAYMDENKYDEALLLLKSLIEQAPDDMKMEVQFYIGDCFYRKGQYRDAVREFMKVKYIPVNNDDDFQWMVTALFEGGKAYEALGEMEKSIELYEHIIRVSGKNTIYGKSAAARIDEIRQH